MSNIKKWLLLLSRVIIGIVFIYSGFVKGIDPLGSTYKFIDYFNAFNTPWANSFSFFLSVIQSAAEFVIGVAILLNLKIKWSSLGALIFMIIFMPLTFYIAIADPVHDCGCFGDALVITNWQTFWKNIILMVPSIFIFLNRKTITNKLNSAEQWVITGVITILFLITIQFNYKHLPILDFRPYKIGTHIPDGMSIPEGALADIWESIFVYEKEGVSEEFAVSNLPDSTWTFVDAKHNLIKKGYEPPIQDFTIVSIDGTDITDIVLSNENYNFLFVAYDIKKTNLNNIDKVNEIANFCYEMGYPFYGLTASGNDVVEKFLTDNNSNYEFYNTDEITLKTMIRSNPGLILLKEGTIINKWHINDIPNVSEFNQNMVHQSISQYKQKADRNMIYIFILSAAFIFSTYLLIRDKLIKN